MSSFLEGILSLPPWLVCAVVGLLVFLEDAIFVGFVLPGETAAVLGGVAASQDHMPLPVIMAVVIGCAILGDTVGFEVGKHFFGPKVMRHRMLASHAHRIHKAEDFLRRRGGSAVFLGRFTAFFRAMMPALAGASRMPYRTFVLWNAAGGIIWGAVFTALGYVAGASYHQLEQKVGRGMAIAVAAIVVIALIAWRVRESRVGAREEREAAAAESDKAGTGAGATGDA